MLVLSVVEEINRLLQEGKLSQRQIAARLEISRGTVGAIASGRRGLFGKEPNEDHKGPIVPQSPPQRCAHCGFAVYMPCLVCRAREFRTRRAALQASGASVAARPAPPRSATLRPSQPRPIGRTSGPRRSRVA